MNASTRMAREARTWVPAPGVLACYTGTRSRRMSRNNRVRVLAESCGAGFVVQPLFNGRPCGLAVAVKAINISPVQGDFFVRRRGVK